MKLPLCKIHISPLNPRRPRADDPTIVELAESIRDHGQHTAAGARPHPEKPGEVELYAGARRRVAFGLAQEWAGAEMEMEVEVREMDDSAFLLALGVEQLQHEDWTAIEEGDYYAALRETLPEGERSERALAELVRKPPARVHRRLQLAALPSAVRAGVAAGRIQLEVAVEIAGLPVDLREEAAAEVERAGEGLTAAAALALLRRKYRPAVAARKFLADAEAAGERVMDDEVRASVLDPAGQIRPGAPWVDLADRPPPEELRRPGRGGRRAPTFGEILGGRAVEVYRAADEATGIMRRLVPRGLVIEADAANKKPVLKAQPSGPSEAEHAAKRAAEERRHRDRRARAVALHDAIVGGDVAVDTGDLLLEIAKLARCELTREDFDFLNERLGMAVFDASHDDRDVPWTARAQLMIIMAFALREHPPVSPPLAHTLRDLAARFGTSLEFPS